MEEDEKKNNIDDITSEARPDETKDAAKISPETASNGIASASANAPASADAPIGGALGANADALNTDDTDAIDSIDSTDSTDSTDSANDTSDAVIAVAGEAKGLAKGKKKRRGKKAPKMVSMKKLPGMLKKAYTLKGLEKKLLRRVYVPQDRAYISSLFTEGPVKRGRRTVNLIRIDRTMMIERRQVKRLKKIIKDVKSQKFGFKAAPFAAVVILIFAAVTVVTTFKNVVTRKLIVGAMQKVFNAKCDIAYLNLSIMGARLEIRGLEQANKNEVMKNIFEVGDIIFDFDLTEALRGKLDVENITVSSIAIGTDRKTSGYLPPKVKTPEEIAKEEAAARKTAQRKAELIQKTKNTLDNMFADYNPKNILGNLQENLKSPAMARQTQEMVETMIDKWKDTPKEMEKSVMDFSKSVEAVVKTNWGGIDDAVKLQDAIVTVDASIKQGKALKEDTEKTIKEFIVDSKAAVQLSKDIAEAIKSDTKLIDKELDKFRDLKDRGIKGVFNDMITAFVYGMADQYSPYIRMGLDYAAKMKKEADANATKKKEVLGDKPKKEKKIVKRAKGRTIYWKQDRVPRVLIEKVYGSGPNWMVDAREISSDADKRGRPATVKTAFTIGSVGSDVNAVIDPRKSSSAPLIKADYTGTGIPSNVVIDSYGMKSTSVITAAISGGGGGKFNMSGNIDMSGVQILTPSFEPEVVYNIYLGAISSFTAMRMGFDAVYSQDDGFNIKLNTDIGDRLQEVFMSTLRRETEKVVSYAKEQAVALLSEKTGGATDKIAEFMGIDNLMEIQKVNVDELNNKLENIKKEIKERLEADARKAAEEGIKQLNKKAEEALKDSGADKYLKGIIPSANGNKDNASNGGEGTDADNSGESNDAKKDPLSGLTDPKNLRDLFKKR